MKKLALYIFLLLTLALIEPVKTHADIFAVGVYPPIMQIQATGPSIITKDFTIVNASENAENVRVVLRQFNSSSTNNGVPEYLPISQIPSPDKDIFKKVQVLDGPNPINTITLSPKQKKILTLRIGLPKDEPGADYYFSILFVSNDAPIISANGTHISAGIGINVLLSIGPKDPTTGFLDKFSAPLFSTSGPIPFTVLASNTSRHFIAPTGQILIRNMFGQLIGKVDLLSVNLLGHSTRFIPSKENKIINNHPVAYWNEKVLFGVYRANIVLSLSDQGPILTRVIYFLVLPWEYVVGFFIFVVIASVVVVRVRKYIRTH